MIYDIYIVHKYEVDRKIRERKIISKEFNQSNIHSLESKA